MQKTRDFSDLYSRYIENDLSTEEKASFEKILREHPEKKQEVDRLNALRTKLQNLSQVKTTPDFDTVLRARIQLSKRIGRRQLFGIPEFILAPALGIVTALILFFALSQFRSSESTASISTTLPANTLFNAQSSPTEQNTMNYSLDKLYLRNMEVQPLNDDVEKSQLITVNSSDTAQDSTGNMHDEKLKPESMRAQQVNMQF